MIVAVVAGGQCTYVRDLLSKLPDSSVLTEEKLLSIDPTKSKNLIPPWSPGTILIVPPGLTDRRYHARKAHMLLVYWSSLCNKYGWTFLLVTPTLDRLDLRLRRQVR